MRAKKIAMALRSQPPHEEDLNSKRAPALYIHNIHARCACATSKGDQHFMHCYSSRVLPLLLLRLGSPYLLLLLLLPPYLSFFFFAIASI